MSALPHETPPRAYASPYRVEAHEGPQTLAEMRAALAVADPSGAELVAFNARYDAARFGTEQAAVLSDARRVLALRTRPEVHAAIAASLAGDEAVPVAELWEYLERRDAAE
ncbi:hypothetical protein [Streptomyces sp. NPDC057910]|uniref:hypothetical protein n=1 Tax=Streptomyces sp. NPDC057910 TaxID=3346278 RepID=UPI0036E8D673